MNKRIKRAALLLAAPLFLSIGLSAHWALSETADECFDIIFAPPGSGISRLLLAPTTPRRSNAGNFVIPFDSSAPGDECGAMCKRLFVTISAAKPPAPIEQWNHLKPEFTGLVSGNYAIYQRTGTSAALPFDEFLVTSEVGESDIEVYQCAPEGRSPNPMCRGSVMAGNGLVAQFTIRRAGIEHAREAGRHVAMTLGQLPVRVLKDICA